MIKWIREDAKLRARVRSSVVSYVLDMQGVIKVVREKVPVLHEWADKMEPLLKELESASK